MFPYWQPPQQQDPVATLKSFLASTDDLKAFIKDLEKKEKEKTEKKKLIKLPQFSLFETTCLVFLLSPVFGILLNPLWSAGLNGWMKLLGR